MSHSRLSFSKSSLGLLFTLCASACSSESSTSTPAEPDSGGSPTHADGTSTDASNVSDATHPGDAPDGGTPSGTGDGETSPSPTSGSDGGSGPTPSDGGSDTSEPDAGATDGETAGGGDGGVEDVWANCPTAVAPPNGEGPLRILVTEGAVYCALFNETRTLVEEKAAKRQLRIAPGVHRVPEVNTPSLALPACVRDEAAAVGVESGSLTVSSSPGEGSTSYTLGFDQALAGHTDRRFEMRLDQTFDDGAPIEFVLDGAETDGLESYQSMSLCDLDGEYCFPSILFTSCSYASGELNTHTVEFAGGTVTFELRVGESFAGTEPGAFVAARGSYADEEFTQEDYFKLVYHPAHHHFERAFVVLFDEPRGDVCGIEVSGLEPFGDDVPDVAFTVDCDLTHLDELPVTSHTLVRSTP